MPPDIAASPASMARSDGIGRSVYRMTRLQNSEYPSEAQGPTEVEVKNLTKW